MVSCRLLLPEGAGAEALLAERYDAQQGQQRLPSEGQLQAASSKGGSDSKAPDGDLGLFDALLEGDAASEAQVWECVGEGRSGGHLKPLRLSVLMILPAFSTLGLWELRTCLVLSTINTSSRLQVLSAFEVLIQGIEGQEDLPKEQVVSVPHSGSLLLHATRQAMWQQCASRLLCVASSWLLTDHIPGRHSRSAVCSRLCDGRLVAHSRIGQPS